MPIFGTVLVIGFFAVGFVLGAIWRSTWALVFPALVAVWCLLPPWRGVGIEVPPWYVAIMFGGSAAAGVACGIASVRFAKRNLSS